MNTEERRARERAKKLRYRARHGERINAEARARRRALGQCRDHRPTLPERFFAKVNKNGPTVREGLGPCWTWAAYRNRGGYGQVAACVNTAHLFEGTDADNVADKMAKGATPTGGCLARLSLARN